MERLTGPDLPEDEPEPPATEPAGLLLRPPGGPPTAIATRLRGTVPDPEPWLPRRSGELSSLGRAARGVLAVTVIVIRLALPFSWYATVALLVVSALGFWSAATGRAFEHSVRQGWRSLRSRRERRRHGRRGNRVRRAA